MLDGHRVQVERLAEDDLQRWMKEYISCQRPAGVTLVTLGRHCIGLRVGKTANEDGANSNQEWHCTSATTRTKSSTHEPLLRAVNFGDRRFIVAFRFADETAIEFHDWRLRTRRRVRGTQIATGIRRDWLHQVVNGVSGVRRPRRSASSALAA